MDIHIKSILRYTETTVKLWPDSIRDALEYFLKEFEQLPSGHGMSKEFRTLIDSVYREGHKDCKQHATFVKYLPKIIEIHFAFLYNKSMRSKYSACRKLAFV